MTGEIEDRTESIEALKLNVNGDRVHYLKAGSGPPVVMVHGGASDSRDWVNAMNALSHRHALYAPDMIGYGQSDRNKDGYYFSDFSDFILDFIETLGLDKPFLVGHSFGARICLEVALRHPEKVRKLVLLDAMGLGKVSLPGNIILIGFWAIRKLLRKKQPYPQFITREGEDSTWTCVKELPNLKTSTLIVWKRHDIYLPLAIARRAEKLIPGARLAVLPGFGHAPHGQNIDAFNRLLLEFFDSK